ncbi:uncharacterized protein METZ01_LOCUS134157 [marine metagenome]|jgi:hypothetical protein|uniref:Uncharacterized protein n=1 Tax=marine metagenome TaxID=408172 RepID=A0A381YXK2_9ZZZZ|tara:strand:+ start:285 stop:629 length:345 start_codon:yes stop_codon:yes gene_type:complete
MGRGEKEDVSNLDLPDPLNPEITFYDTKGQKVTNQNEGVAKSVKTVLSYDNISIQQFILYGRGEILDPHGVDFRSNRNFYKFKKVPKDAFDNYIKYLKSKNTLYFTRARRLITE